MTEQPAPDGDCRCPDILVEMPCGCGEEHNARLYRDHVVHFCGRQWRVGCAFDASLNAWEALRIIAGESKPSYGTVLHDVSRIGDFAARVLAGGAPRAALREM